MKNFDLEKQMKSLRVPEREEEYWETFSKNVMRSAQRRAAEQPARNAFVPRFAWSFGLATACLFAGFFLTKAGLPQKFSHTIAHRTVQIRHDMTQIHAGLNRLMQDEHGLHRLVEDQL